MAAEVSETEARQQLVLTAFFRGNSTSATQSKTLFDKLDEDRKIAKENEKKKEKERVKAEKRRHKELEVEEQEKRDTAWREEREKTLREKEASYEGAEIIEGLYLGSRKAAINFEWLREGLEAEDTVHILNVTKETTNYHEDNALFKYKRVEIEDAFEENIAEHFEAAFKFISEGLNASKRVLGKSRSATIIVAFLMKHRSKTLFEAHHLITSKTPWTLRINPGFQRQLMELDLKLQGKETAISLDFFEKKTRAVAQLRKNYSELDEKQSRRRKAKEPEKPKNTLLSFSHYWKILQAEKEGKSMESVKKDFEREAVDSLASSTETLPTPLRSDSATLDSSAFQIPISRPNSLQFDSNIPLDKADVEKEKTPTEPILQTSKFDIRFEVDAMEVDPPLEVFSKQIIPNSKADEAKEEKEEKVEEEIDEVKVKTPSPKRGVKRSIEEDLIEVEKAEERLKESPPKKQKVDEGGVDPMEAEPTANENKAQNKAETEAAKRLTPPKPKLPKQSSSSMGRGKATKKAAVEKTPSVTLLSFFKPEQ